MLAVTKSGTTVKTLAQKCLNVYYYYFFFHFYVYAIPMTVLHKDSTLMGSYAVSTGRDLPVRTKLTSRED